MSKTIITITEMRSMPGRYEYSIKQPGGRVRSADAGFCPGSAAAKAIDLALHFGSRGYVIFGPDKVMSRIPLELRST